MFAHRNAIASSHQPVVTHSSISDTTVDHLKHLTTMNQVSMGMQTLKSSIKYSSTTPLLNSQHKHVQDFSSSLLSSHGVYDFGTFSAQLDA
jgi:hypothetical protein